MALSISRRTKCSAVSEELHIFRLESQKGRGHSEDLGINGREWILQNVIGGSYWIKLAQVRDMW